MRLFQVDTILSKPFHPATGAIIQWREMTTATIDGERRFELGLVGAAGGFRYDNFGNLLGEVRGNLDAVKVETQGEAAPLVRRMKGWKKRA